MTHSFPHTNSLMSPNNKRNLELAREMLSPPGDTIQETIDALGMNQYELAERMGRPVKTVNEIIKGKEAVTPATAVQLVAGARSL